MEVGEFWSVAAKIVAKIRWWWARSDWPNWELWSTFPRSSAVFYRQSFLPVEIFSTLALCNVHSPLHIILTANVKYDSCSPVLHLFR